MDVINTNKDGILEMSNYIDKMEARAKMNRKQKRNEFIKDVVKTIGVLIGTAALAITMVFVGISLGMSL